MPSSESAQPQTPSSSNRTCSSPNVSRVRNENIAAPVLEQQDDSAYEGYKQKCDDQIPGYDARSLRYPFPKHGDHWQACHEVAEKHDNSLCGGWNDDINTLLVFAGLFSATVTAFTIESYQWLQPNSTDTTAHILLHISQQIANGSTSAATVPIESPSASQRRINIFWSLSLVVALITALLGILCKQWLREYQKDAALSYKDSLALRQLRFEAFKYWRIEDFISTLPLLLQLALLLFIIGILDLLWTIDHLAAAIVSFSVFLGFGVVGITTALPVAVLIWNNRRLAVPKHLTTPSCAYKSPQSWLLLRAVLLLYRSFGLTFSSWLAAEKTEGAP